MARFSLPIEGMTAEAVLSEMDDARGGDVKWRDGRAFSLVYYPGDELSAFIKEAYTRFISENALNPSAFPSLRRFENEVVAMTANLLGGDAEVCGNMTSGGTESILMAVKAAREWGLAQNPKRGEMEMILPVTAHPAFHKAAHYFGVKAVLVPVRSDFRVNIKAVKKAITKRTVMIVGSAPAYPQGIVDPITELARTAAEAGLLCHVDACVGGMMLPFVRSLGYPVPGFDFSVPGVTSISVDLHKYGYAAKGASVILFKDAELRKKMFYAYTDWPGGIYASPTMTGTRGGGAIAAAWAIMKRLGYDGYRDIAREVMETTTRIREGIEALEDVHVLGNPHMSILAVASDTVDIYDVGDAMTERGWAMDRQQYPACLHLTLNYAHVEHATRFLADLKEAVALSRKEPMEKMLDRSKLVLANTVVRALPAGVASRLTAVASKSFGVEGTSLPKKSAAMYGMMAALPNRGDLKTVIIDLLDKMTRLKEG